MGHGGELLGHHLTNFINVTDRAVTDQKSPACPAFAHEGQAAPSMDCNYCLGCYLPGLFVL